MKSFLNKSAKHLGKLIVLLTLLHNTAVAQEIDLDIGTSVSTSRKYVEFWIENYEEFDVACDWIKRGVSYLDATTGEQFAERDVSTRNIVIESGSFYRELEGGKRFIDAWEAQNRSAVIERFTDARPRKSCHRATKDEICQFIAQDPDLNEHLEVYLAYMGVTQCSHLNKVSLKELSCEASGNLFDIETDQCLTPREHFIKSCNNPKTAAQEFTYNTMRTHLAASGAPLNCIDTFNILDRETVLINQFQSYPFQDLTPFIHFKNTKGLDLRVAGDVEIDLAIFYHLANSLSHLTIRGNGIIKLNQLKILKSLTHLSLIDNRHLSDITLLGELDQIQHLEFSGTNVSDLRPLKSLNHLSSIEANWSKINPCFCPLDANSAIMSQKCLDLNDNFNSAINVFLWWQPILHGKKELTCKEGPIVAPTGNITCDSGYIQMDDQCILGYEYKFQRGRASGWFGGDSRENFTPRNVGTGQSVKMEKSLNLTQFAFNFSRQFKDASGTIYYPTVVLQVRDSRGNILKTFEKITPRDFRGGWFFWDVDINLYKNRTYIFTSYAKNALRDGFTNGYRGDSKAGYTAGEGYSTTISPREREASFNPWSKWHEHPWDRWFWLKGRYF